MKLGLNQNHKTERRSTVINVTFSNLHLYVPTLIPRAEKQVNYNEFIKNSFTLSFESWTADGEVVNTELEYQVDICSAVNVISPNYLIWAHQTEARAGPANKAINISVFDHVDVRNFFCEIGTARYPNDSVNFISTNDYLV